MDRGRRLVAEAAQVGPAADRLELVAPLQGLRDGHDIDGLAPLEQVQDGRVDPRIRLAVEVLGPQELGDLDDGIAVDEDGPEHGLLSFEALRWQAIDHGAVRLRRFGWGPDGRRRMDRSGPQMAVIRDGPSTTCDPTWTRC